MVALFVLYIVAMAAATFVEKGSSTAVAREWFYGSVWFIALQGLLGLNFIAMSIDRKMWQNRRWGLLILHYGFVVALIGALTTHILGVEGIIHVRTGENQSTVTDTKGAPIGRLPFELTLNDFTVERYGGTSAASNYISQVTAGGDEQTISMNNPLRKDGWRIYQMSFDSDERGAWYSASYDSTGTTISYIGYLMIVLGMILALCARGSHLRRMIASLGVLAICILPSMAANKDDVVKRFERLVVENPTGRMQSVGSYADDLMRKIAKSNHIGNQGASEILLGILTDPYTWSMRSLIADTAGVSVAFISLIATDGSYKLGTRVETIERKAPTDRNKAEKELLKFNERVNILDNLLTGKMFDIFPRENSPYWYSPGEKQEIAADFASMPKDSLLVGKIWGWFADQYRTGNYDKAAEILDMIATYQQAKSPAAAKLESKIEAELLLTRTTPFRWGGYLLMTLGLLLVAVSITRMISSRKLRIEGISLTSLTIAVWLMVTTGIILRWYISGRAPMSSAYETMVFVGWATTLVGFLFARRSLITFALSTFLSGVLLFVSNLSWMDPQITPLVPVLNSPWLIAHVAVITSSYSFFGVCFLLGLTTLTMIALSPKKLSHRISELTAINTIAANIGLMLLVAGTFLGAVWANESWGRYWGWDPKETWALITIIAYSILTHIHLTPSKNPPYRFALLSVISLGSVLMTFFGVNYFLSGMHSYGSDSTPPTLWIIAIIYLIIISLALLIPRLKR